MMTSSGISAKSQTTLQRFAKEDQQTIEEVLNIAIESYRRQRFFDRANADFDRLRSDPEANASYEEDQRLFDNTIADGLEDW